MQRISWRLEAFAYDVLKLIMTPFGFKRISSFGGWLFERIGPLTSKHHIAKTGLKLAFPDAGEEQIDAWMKPIWNNVGRTFAEFPLLPRLPIFHDDAPVEIIGIEKLEELKADKQAAVFVGGHFANWEVMPALLATSGLPIQLTYRHINNPHMDKRIRDERAAYGAKLMIAKSGAKGAKALMQALAAGESVALMNDQKFNEGIEVPFFGVNAMTAPGPVRLALRAKVPLVPMSVERVNGSDFRVTVFDPIELTRSGDRHQDIRDGVLKVNAFLEEQIRKDPTNWFWVHRRWPKPHYRK